MDLGTTLIGSTVIAICAFPFIAVYAGKKKQQKKVVQTLQDYATEHQCHISKKELCGDFAIGLDEQNKTVFFVKQHDNGKETKLANLENYQTCTPNTVIKTITTDSGKSSTITKVELHFKSSVDHEKDTSFTFYDDHLNAQLSNEVVVANSWSKSINSYLN